MAIQFQSLLKRMLELIIKKVEREPENDVREVYEVPKAMALKKSMEMEQEEVNTQDSSQDNGGASSGTTCHIWPFDLGMGWGPSSGLKVKCR